MRLLHERSAGGLTTPFAATSPAAIRRLATPLVPNRVAVRLQREARLYNVLWSPSGNLLVSATQDENIALHAAGRWRAPLARIRAEDVSWAVSSVSVSEDEQLLVYSSMSSTLHLVNIGEVAAAAAAGGAGSADATAPPQLGAHTAVELSPPPPSGTAGRQRVRSWRNDFAVYQCAFSGGSTEVIAACGDNSVRVFDLERNCVAERIVAHEDDVNSVCFVDSAFKSSLLATASDDGLCKVFDRREGSLGDAAAAAGDGGGSGGSSSSGDAPGAVRRAAVYLPGHLAGLTCVSSRGDGVHLVTNGKDCCAKVWDLRRGHSHGDWATRQGGRARFDFPFPFDYRWQTYPGAGQPPVVHPHDCSLLTLRGHAVSQTLIRCYFSPAATTGRRYVYSGSADGRVLVWDLAAAAADGAVDPSVLPGDAAAGAGGADDAPRSLASECAWVPGLAVPAVSTRAHARVVRDVAWHPHLPLLATAGFDGCVGVLDYGEDAAHTAAAAAVDAAAAGEQSIRAARAARARRFADFQARRQGGAAAGGASSASSGSAAAPASASASSASGDAQRDGSGGSGSSTRSGGEVGALPSGDAAASAAAPAAPPPPPAAATLRQDAAAFAAAAAGGATGRRAILGGRGGGDGGGDRAATIMMLRQMLHGGGGGDEDDDEEEEDEDGDAGDDDDADDDDGGGEEGEEDGDGGDDDGAGGGGGVQGVPAGVLMQLLASLIGGRAGGGGGAAAPAAGGRDDDADGKDDDGDDADADP